MFTKKLGLSPKLAVTNIVLVATAFIWYFLAFNVLQQLVQEAGLVEFGTLVFGVNVSCIVATAVIGSLLSDKLSREKILIPWMAIGVPISLTPLLGFSATLLDLLIIAVIFGGYFGLGMPAVMGYFSRSTKYENRARLGGIIFIVMSLTFVLIGNLASNQILASVALALIQISGLSVFIKFKPNSTMLREERKISYLGVLTNRPVLLFLIPWLMFNMVNYMTLPVAAGLSESDLYGFGAVENIIVAISALLTGFLADSKGRKRLAITSFAMLGVGYAAMGLSPNIYGWYIHTMADGIAWGILYVLFLFTLWGDLAQDQKSEKFYVMGALPFMLSNFMTELLYPLISNVEIVALFSFASFFLFAAVLPLFFAPETLPEKVMKVLDLQNYVEKAKQKAEKESEKSQRKHSDQAEEENDKEKDKPEESPEDEEARKLAEKYY